MRYFLMILMCIATGAQAGLQTEISLGYREDCADWSIPADPVITSKVEWKDLRMFQVGALFRFCGLGGLYAKAYGDYAWIFHGISKDRDFTGVVTPQEYMRTISDASQGETYDLSIGGGYQVLNIGILMIASTGGFGYMQQHLYMFDGKTIICVDNPALEGKEITGLDSKYFNRWQGPWAGFDAQLFLGNLAIYVDYEYHWTTFFGKGDWNLRRDLASGFYDKANGGGSHVNVRALYFTHNCLSIGIGVDFWKFKAKNGTSEFAVPDEVSETGEVLSKKWMKVDFSHVNWQSVRVNGIISMSF